MARTAIALMEGSFCGGWLRGMAPGVFATTLIARDPAEREVKRVRVPRMDSEFSDAWLPRREGRPPEPAAG